MKPKRLAQRTLVAGAAAALLAGSIYAIRVSNAALEPAVSAPAASALGRGETLLVVEDDDGVRAAINEVLDGEGYRVLATSGVPDAMCSTAGSENPS